jgi:hypothetical protein
MSFTASRRRRSRSPGSGHSVVVSEEHATGREERDRCHRLRHDRRVVTERGRHDARPEARARRLGSRGAEPGEREGSVAAGVAPRMEVVAYGNAVVAKLLREHGVVEESLGVELLRGRFPAER